MTRARTQIQASWFLVSSLYTFLHTHSHIYTHGHPCKHIHTHKHTQSHIHTLTLSHTHSYHRSDRERRNAWFLGVFYCLDSESQTPSTQDMGFLHLSPSLGSDQLLSFPLPALVTSWELPFSTCFWGVGREKGRSRWRLSISLWKESCHPWKKGFRLQWRCSFIGRRRYVW